MLIFISATVPSAPSAARIDSVKDSAMEVGSNFDFTTRNYVKSYANYPY